MVLGLLRLVALGGVRQWQRQSPIPLQVLTLAMEE